MFDLLFKLLCSHAVADFCLQSEFIAKNKNRNSGTPAGYNPILHGPVQTIWPYVLTSHALTHGLGVYLVTGSVGLGIAETACHWLIDFGKCERLFGIHTDQGLHFVCKLLWAYAVVHS